MQATNTNFADDSAPKKESQHPGLDAAYALFTEQRHMRECLEALQRGKLTFTPDEPMAEPRNVEDHMEAVSNEAFRAGELCLKDGLGALAALCFDVDRAIRRASWHGNGVVESTLVRLAQLTTAADQRLAEVVL